MTEPSNTTFTDPDGKEVPEHEVRRLYAQQVPWAVRAMCLASNTPVPEFAREPNDPRADAPDQLVFDLRLPASA